MAVLITGFISKCLVFVLQYKCSMLKYIRPIPSQSTNNGLQDAVAQYAANLSKQLISLC